MVARSRWPVQSGAPVGLQANRSGGSKRFPVVRPRTAISARWTLCSRRAEDEKSEALPSAPQGPVPSVRRARLPNRGVRERPDAVAGCHAAPEGRIRSAAITERKLMPEKLASPSMRVQTARLRLGSRDCRAVKLLSTQIVRKQAKAIFSSPTTRHVACNVVVNAFQQYEWLAGLATAKLERRSQILTLAHPPTTENGANLLEIHDTRLLKSGASRQEKASACNRNCAATDEHF